MYFHKIHDPINCSFPSRFDAARRRLTVGEHTLDIALDDLGHDVFRVRVSGARWPHQHSQAALQAPNERADELPASSRARLSLGQRAELELLDVDGVCLLRSVAGESFGVCGSAWLFHFELPSDAQFYGMGEKGVGFERSGLRTKFWNTDVWADFPMSQVRHAATDPMYASVPWVIIKQVNRDCSSTPLAPRFCAPRLRAERLPIGVSGSGLPTGSPSSSSSSDRASPSSRRSSSAWSASRRARRSGRSVTSSVAGATRARPSWTS
jgi:hypothetical protein